MRRCDLQVVKTLGLMTRNFPSAPLTILWESRIFVIHGIVKITVLAVTIRPRKYICDPVCKIPDEVFCFVLFCDLRLYFNID